MQRPHVLINVAATVDGKIDTRDRRGAAISSDVDKQRVDELRAAVDAVMVGGRTLHDEDPRLTVKSEALREARVARGEPPNPMKVGVASRLALRPDSRFLTVGPARVVVFTTRGGVADVRGAEVYEIGDGRVDLSRAMAQLAEMGVRRVLVEGGGTLNFELLRLGLVDELSVFVAPLVLGGATAPTLADGEGLPRHAAIRLAIIAAEPCVDGGVLLRYKVEQS